MPKQRRLARSKGKPPARYPGIAVPIDAIRQTDQEFRTRRFLEELEALWAKVEVPPGLDDMVESLRARGINVTTPAPLADRLWSLDDLSGELRALFRVSRDRTRYERAAEVEGTFCWVYDPDLVRHWVNPDAANDPVPVDRATAEEIAARVWGGLDLDAPAELWYVYERGYRPFDRVEPDEADRPAEAE